MAVALEDAGMRHRRDEEVAQGPDERVDAVGGRCGRDARGPSRGPWGVAGEGAHLVFENGKRAEVTHLALLVQRCDGLGARDLAARRVHRAKRHVRIDHAQGRLVHIAAIVDFGDDAVGVVRAVRGDRRLGPLDRLIPSR